MDEIPRRYNIETDEIIPVTQEWVHSVEATFATFGAARRAARSAIEIRDGLFTNPPPELQAFLDAWKPEFAQNIEKYIKERDDALNQQETGAHDGSSRAQSEIRQEGRDSGENGEGVQQGGRGETQGQVAVAYAVTVDGFIQIKPKAIRNLQSPFVIWMTEAQWAKLANCATTQGQFYIPRTDTIDSPAVLRALVYSQ